MGNGVAADVTDARFERVKKLAAEGDYSKCPVPGQGEIQELELDVLYSLYQNQQPTSNGKITWGNFEATGKAATVLARIAGVVALIYILYLLHGGQPIPFKAIADNTPTIPESAMASQ